MIIMFHPMQNQRAVVQSVTVRKEEEEEEENEEQENLENTFPAPSNQEEHQDTTNISFCFESINSCPNTR